MFCWWYFLYKLETVHVSFTWENELEVPLPINNVFLECSFNGISVNHTFVKGEELPSILEYPDFSIQVIGDVSLDANEKRQVCVR